MMTWQSSTRVQWVSLFLALCFAMPLCAQQSSIERDVRKLSSSQFNGRMTGSAGAQDAAAYLIERLQAIGAAPLAGYDSMLHPFEFTAGSHDTGSVIELHSTTGTQRWTGTQYVRALPFSVSESVTADVVFAGYGLVVPDEDGFSYNSYFGLDVKDKIVLVLRYSPEDTEGELRGRLARYSGLRYKALQARERGAAALLVVSGPRSAASGETIALQYDAALAGSGIIGASISSAVSDQLFASVEGGLRAAQEALDSGNPHISGFELPGVRVTVDASIERVRRTGRNVLAQLSGAASSDAGWVMLGAHYDHLGIGNHGGSRADESEIGEVHPGADDNASGVAAVLEVGRQLSARKDRPNTVLAFWSGEELGLLGSSHFVKDAPVPLQRFYGYLNFDMVGRLRDNRIILQGTGSSDSWQALLEQANEQAAFDLRLQRDPYLPTDSTQLYQAGLPVVNFFTGTHDDYHRPADSADKLNYPGLQRVADYATDIAMRLSGLETAPVYVEVERSRKNTGGRHTLRAYTGTIPDYGSDVAGLALSGVVAGGPAAVAGIEAGDVIVEFAGHTITNIYDYTFALETIVPGAAVSVVGLRGDARVEFSIVPEIRQ